MLRSKESRKTGKCNTAVSLSGMLDPGYPEAPVKNMGQSAMMEPVMQADVLREALGTFTAVNRIAFRAAREVFRHPRTNGTGKT